MASTCRRWPWKRAAVCSCNWAAASRAAGALEAPSQQSNQEAVQTSWTMEREAAATERRPAGRRKVERKRQQQVMSLALWQESPSKDLKRGREVEKIIA